MGRCAVAVVGGLPRGFADNDGTVDNGGWDEGALSLERGHLVDLAFLGRR